MHFHLADDQHLALSRKPWKRPVSSLREWVKCFTVYANTLCAYQPTRGPDMLGYLFIIASSLQEFSLPAVLVYDIAFRRKAALLKLLPWGQIDLLLYSRAFTGPGRAKAYSTCPLCLNRATQPRCAIYIQRDQPRSPGAYQLVHDARPQPIRKYALTSTVGGASGTTTPVSTSTLQEAAAAPMPPSAVPRGDPPPANCSNLPLSLPLPPSHSVWHVPPSPAHTHPVHHHLSPSTTPTLTPLCVRTLAHLLSGHPCREWVNYLLRGFTFGFSTGYTGPYLSRHSPNLPSTSSRPAVISDYIAKECAAGHTAGSFPNPPLPNFMVNPLGAVPKKRSGKWRLIVHLSFPSGNSINDGIDITHFPLRYSTVADTMDSCMRLGKGALMAKLDVQSAFRLCPVIPAEHHLLGMFWQGRYFYNQVLPLDLWSAPFTLTEATEWIAKEHEVNTIHHYLNDFFVAGKPDFPACSKHLCTLTSLCNTLGIPLVQEKLEGPSTQLEYLGVLLDTNLLEARLPLDKLQDLKLALAEWLHQDSGSKRELLSLIGSLSFTAKTVPAGRTFLHQLLNLRMDLLRNLFLLAAQHNCMISAKHILGIHNPIADSLSRFHMQAFHRHAPEASPDPTPIPSLPFMHIR